MLLFSTQDGIAHSKITQWLTDDVIELSLLQQPSKLFVPPLRPVPEGFRDDEVRVIDIAMLVGQYVAIGEWDESSEDPNDAFIMTNYLKVVSREE